MVRLRHSANAAQHLSRLLLAGSSTLGSKLDVTERPRSITGLPQPSPSHCQGQQAPLPSAWPIAEPQPTADAKRSSMSLGNPSLQPGSGTSTADVLGSSPTLKHRDINSIRTQPLRNSSKAATSFGPETARSAAAVPSCGKTNQVRPCCAVMLCHGIIKTHALPRCVNTAQCRHVALACEPHCSHAHAVHSDFQRLSCMILSFMSGFYIHCCRK